jgi:hypothetical protein
LRRATLKRGTGDFGLFSGLFGSLFAGFRYFSRALERRFRQTHLVLCRLGPRTGLLSLGSKSLRRSRLFNPYLGGCHDTKPRSKKGGR